jgi:hypothetical protein
MPPFFKSSLTQGLFYFASLNYIVSLQFVFIKSLKF